MRLQTHKQKALRVDRTAVERKLSLRDPPQAENPASQDSIFIGNCVAFPIKQDFIFNKFRKTGENKKNTAFAMEKE